MNMDHKGEVPWSLDDEFSIYDSRSRRIAILRDHGTPDHAALIVRAVNAHDDMLAALKALAADEKWQNAPHELLKIAAAAIARAEGRS